MNTTKCVSARLAVVFLLLVGFSSPPSLVMGSCSRTNNQCDPYSGKCSTTVDTFFAALAEDASRGDLEKAFHANAKLFAYGKYCGASNKCPGETNSNGRADNAPEPCNDIDGACQTHDACLDDKGKSGLERVYFPERCDCDVGLVRAMKQVEDGEVEEGSSTSPSTMMEVLLCDENFYDLGFPETAVIALPFCLTIMDPSNGCTTMLEEAIMNYCFGLFSLL